MADQNKSILICKTAPEWIEYAKTLPDPEMLFDSFWFEGELCFLFSDTGSGKTVLSVQIAQSIATGQPIHEDVRMNGKQQTVFLCEFELSPKQFETRYKDKSTGEYFKLSDNIIRAELDLSKFDFKNDLQESVIEAIRNELTETKIKILIIDNITFIQDTNKFDQAIRFMQKMNKMKRELGLSILVLGHTPKRNMMEPITQNSMTGSKKLMDLSDSSFTIGKSSKGENIRYLKQIKVRQDAFKYGSENVLDCEIIKNNGFLSFQINGESPEFSHLKKQNSNEKRNSDIIEAYQSNEFTQKELAEKFGMSDRQVRRIIDNHLKESIEDDLPF
ncbi:MAG: AAA family ATPase [Bacteroidales bacterium]|nr:AAA family ATPase [Bacteroidales bacterium]